MIRPSDYKCPMTREKCSANCPWCIEIELEDKDWITTVREYECAIRVIAWSVSEEKNLERRTGWN